MTSGWPATLQVGPVTLRPLAYRDARAWRAVRHRNAAFRTLVTRLNRHARQGQGMPFAIDVDGQFAGQVTVNNIVRGSAQFGSVGYWLDRDVAGRGVMPTAVALVIDHCFRSAGLHRIEVCIRPENSNSLRVMEKLGIREVGYSPRFLHVEECPEGMLARLSLPSHE